MLDLEEPEVLRAVLESLKTGVCIVDQERKIVFWNEGAEEVTGYLRQEVLGRSCRDDLLVHFDENDAALCNHACPVLAAMRDGQPREVHIYLHHKAGYPVPVSVRAVPIRNAHDQVIGAAESFVEIHCASAQRLPGSDLAVGHGLDAVTRLPDQAFTDAYLGERLKFAAEHVIPFGLLSISLDQFESIMATQGLSAAEALLNVAAHTLRKGLDPLDYVGRRSNSQFLVMVTDRGESALQATGEQLKRLISCSAITWWGDPLSVTASVGGTAVKPGETLESLTKRLAEALQQSVSAGGNCVTVLSPTEP
jgi:PAS domain S-box-containing protein/diguanylate cyclase (GGDEF)-like protein